MNCTLCKKPINNFNAELHHPAIDEESGVNVCPECAEKFIKWQGKNNAKYRL